jgi:hypothetical protein
VKLIGLMPVRNEDWCLGLTLRAALIWCDQVIVLLHACTDRSADIARGLARSTGRRVAVVECVNPQWDEMPQRQLMLETAREQSATHIALIDADEILTGNLLHSIRMWIEHLKPNECLNVGLFNLRGGISRYHSNGIWGDRVVSLAFPDDPKLAWRGDQFHHREPDGALLEPITFPQMKGGAMHLWGANERRLIAKHALYKMTETLRWPAKSRAGIDSYYSLAIKADGWTFEDVPPEWWAPYSHWLPMLKPDAEPWQEAECSRLLKEHGRVRFEGLDLFGFRCE